MIRGDVGAQVVAAGRIQAGKCRADRPEAAAVPVPDIIGVVVVGVVLAALEQELEILAE